MLTIARRLRVLFVSHHAPWPVISGGRLRDAQLLPRLLPHGDVEFVAVTRTLRADCKATADYRLAGLTIHLYADESDPGVLPGRASRAAIRTIRRLASETAFDLVHAEGHYLLPLVPPPLLDRTIIVEHNVESTLLEQRHRLGHPQVSRREVERLRWQEQAAWRAVAAVVALTPEDLAVIAEVAPSSLTRLIPNGSDHIPLRTPGPADVNKPAGANSRLVFLANFGYPPNIDAAAWLLDVIFPRIRVSIPGVLLVLAGANADDDLWQRAAREPGVELVGRITSVEEELDRADVVLCPLRVGGGIKVKILEALRRGCLVASTSIALRGLTPGVRAAVACADGAEDFAALVVELCKDRRIQQRQRERLARVQHLMPTWDAAAKELTELWRQVADLSGEQGNGSLRLRGSLSTWRKPLWSGGA